MQVDESDGLHAAGKDAKVDLLTNLDYLQQSPNSNTGASFRSEPPKENAIIPVSPEEGPPGNEASQRSSDSAFCEQVYQELQQQFEDAQAKERERQIYPPKRSGTADEIPETKTPPKKKSSDSRQKLPRKPVPRAAPKRGDGLSHCLARREVNAHHVSSGAANKNSVNEILRNKRRQSHFHHLKQMVSRDVSLQNMDFQEEDLQRAVSLYENLNATACFYTAALRIVSKANWDKQVNFENHIGHQAMVAIAKGWTCAAQLPNDDFDHYHLALAMSTLPEDTHMDLLRTYEAIVAIIPPPFHDLLGSRVSFTCRSCCKTAELEVATFIVTDPPSGLLLHVVYFEAAFPWSEHLLPVGTDNSKDACQECASNFDWATKTCSPCRLVWLQYVRTDQPLATDYERFLNKDTFHSRGQTWQCIALIIHLTH